MARGLRMALSALGAVAIAVSAMQVGAPPVAALPGDADPAESAAVTVEVEGQVMALQTESPRMNLDASHADRDHGAGEDHGHDGAHTEGAEVIFTLQTDGGELIALDESFERVVGEDPEPESRFSGELAVPEETLAGLGDEGTVSMPIAPGETLDLGSPEAEAAVEALVDAKEPATVTAGTLSPPQPEVSARSVKKQHRLYVAVMTGRGSQPTDEQINTRVSKAASYWQAQGNGALTMKREATKRYAPKAATAGTHCGLRATGTSIDRVFTEAVQRFPGVSFDANSANHLVVVVPEQCAAGEVGLGSLGSSFASGGMLLVASGTTTDTLNEFEHTLAHELGHNLGFAHAFGRFCAGGNCLNQEYGDLYSVMGFSTRAPGIPTLNTPSREYQGVTDAGEVTTVRAGRTASVTLKPRAGTAGVRAAKIVDPSGEVHYLEYRSATGRDAGAYEAEPGGYYDFQGRDVAFASGVTVLRHDPGCRSVGQQCNLSTNLIGHPATSAGPGVFSAFLSTGQSYRGPNQSFNAKIDSIANGEAKATISVANVLKLTATPTPRITGAARVGKKLTAKSSTWSPGKVTVKYRWLRNGKSIKGATKASYTLRAADRGARISVRATGSRTGFTSVTKESKRTAKVATGKLKSAKPKITGKKRVGSVVRATPRFSPKASVSYRWLRDGTAIGGATKAKYTLKSRDGGKKISVRVTAKKAGFTTVTRVSAKTSRIAR